MATSASRALDTTGPAPVDVLLIGLGSIGSIYAYLLERSGRARVTAVARSNYALYSASGVTLDTERFGRIEGWKPYRVVRSQTEALAGDIHYAFCIICTKCLPDVLPTPKLVAEVISSGKVAAWSLMQNGLEVEQDLYQAVKELGTPIISNCVWVGIMTSEDGKMVRWSGKDTLVSGLYPPLAPSRAPQNRTFSQSESAALELWADLITSGGGHIHLEDRIDSIRFSKNVWNCAWSSVQGLVRATPACFAPLDPSLQDQIKKFIREIVDAGYDAGLLAQDMTQWPGGELMGDRAEVAEHCWTKIMTASVAKMKATGGGHKMSLLIDVEMGRPIEVEVITGAVLRVAQQNGTPTPLLEFTYALLKGLQVEILRLQRLRLATDAEKAV